MSLNGSDRSFVRLEEGLNRDGVHADVAKRTGGKRQGGSCQARVRRVSSLDSVTDAAVVRRPVGFVKMGVQVDLLDAHRVEWRRHFGQRSRLDDARNLALAPDKQIQCLGVLSARLAHIERGHRGCLGASQQRVIRSQG